MAKAKTQKRQRMIACRFCNARAKADRDSRSHFMHGHPSVCPYRQDRVPVMNGVHVGDLWRNAHVGSVCRVIELRLGGEGTYTDREAVVVTVDIWRAPAEAPPDGDQLSLEFGPAPEPSLEELAVMEPDENAYVWSHPLWSLVEHADPLTRPGEYPVPFEERDGMRWVEEAWRGPGYRRIEQDPDDPNPPVEPREQDEAAYWHSRFVVQGHAIKWHGDEWLVECHDE